MLTRLLAASAIIAAPLVGLATAPAHAEDARPCVTRHEFREFPANPGTRASIEKAWDVRGTNARQRVRSDQLLPLGVRQNLTPDLVLYQYRWCEHGPKRGAFFVYYRRSDMTWTLTTSWLQGQSPLVAYRR